MTSFRWASRRFSIAGPGSAGPAASASISAPEPREGAAVGGAAGRPGWLWLSHPQTQHGGLGGRTPGVTGRPPRPHTVTVSCCLLAGSKESLFSCTLTASEEAMAVLEEVILYAFQQCVYYVSKVRRCRLVGTRGRVCSSPPGGGLRILSWTAASTHLSPGLQPLAPLPAPPLSGSPPAAQGPAVLGSWRAGCSGQ